MSGLLEQLAQGLPGLLATQRPEGLLSKATEQTGVGLTAILNALRTLPDPRPGLREAQESRRLGGTGSSVMGLSPLEQMRQKQSYDRMLDLATGFMPMGVGAIAYHGSPHKWAAEAGFPFGRFKPEAAGTGQGAASYGHAPGGYWAENKAVAKSYDSAISAKGHLYKADIPDEAIAKMLDWNKSFAEQSSEVRQAILRAAEIKRSQAGTIWHPEPQRKGEDILRTLGEQSLHQAGIPGVKYLDQGSRGAGEGTRNFVVFDPALPKVIGRE